MPHHQQTEPVTSTGVAQLFRGTRLRQALVPTMFLLLVCWVAELGGRYLYALGFTDSFVRDMMGLGAFIILLSAAIYVFRRIRSPRIAKTCLLAGITALVLFQVSDLIDESGWSDHYSLLSKGTAAHEIFEMTLIVSGSLLLIAGFFYALLASEALLRQLDEERLHLAEEVGERERAEAELQKTQRDLERVVATRTAELATTNDQLRVELEGRREFEKTLALRLRYEEGLANCSHVLLADSDPPEALKRALHQLLFATDASRVYLFENVQTEDGDGGLAELTHEAWDEEKCPNCKEDLGLRINYTEQVPRWREMLSAGLVVSGVLEDLPQSEREVCCQFGVKSILLLPVGWEGRWRGFLGFDDTRQARVWLPEEIRILRTAAEMVGACKERQHAEAALRLAHGELEKRVLERTSELLAANDQLSREIASRRRTEREKHRLESQLRRAQKMQAIGTLAGGIAHDFNNILASILGYTELTLRKMDPADPLHRYVDEVLKAANRAKELVRQILLFSRQVEHEKAPVHLHLIAQEVAALVAASCPANIDVRKHIDSEAGAVLGDAVQLHQVLLNLCNNAQHEMKRTGGLLDISVQKEEIDSSQHTMHGVLLPGTYVTVAVSDTGQGIDPVTQERIFEPFFTTKTVAEGTGMGLAMAHGVITGMGGVINLDSQIGQGSTFTIYLPQHVSAEAKPEAQQDVLEGHGHVLVVDDEPQLVALWTELLQQYGYQVSGYSNSLRALEMFKRAPETFDIVLLDQTMPGMTGTELAKHMLGIRSDLPIIMATGFSETVTPESAQEIGIRDLVYKPILGNDLARAICRAMNGSIVVEVEEEKVLDRVPLA